MANLTLFQSYFERVLKAQFDFSTHTFKCAITNTLPDIAVDQVLTDLTEITAENGYPAGGLTLDNVAVSRTGGIAKVIIDDETFQSVGGTVGPQRYYVVYSDTHVDKPLVGYTERDDGSFTMLDGDIVVLDFDQANGAFDYQAAVSP